MIPKTRTIRVTCLGLLLLGMSHTACTVADSNEKADAEAFIRSVLDDKPQPIMDWLKKGANVNQVTGTGQSILCAASMLGKSEAVKVLINHGAALLDDCLVTAVANGHTTIAAPFLDRGKSPNLPTGENGDRLLHLAVRSGDVSMVQFLLARGADSTLKNTGGDLALDIAVRGKAAWQSIEDLLGGVK